jgi:hypothetical protein
MHLAKLLIASCMLAAAGTSMASAQFVDPFKVLEEAKRDRLERDKRLAREAAERQRKEKADQAGLSGISCAGGGLNIRPPWPV